MSREIMQQALEALRLVGKYTDSLTCYASTISEHEANIVDPSVQLAIAALEAELAKPEQPDLRKAAEMAVEALKEIHVGNMTPMAEENWNKALTALEAELAKPEQEHEIRITALEIRVAKLENPMTIHEKQLLAGQRGLLRTAPNVSTNQQNVNTSEERVHKSDECVQEPVAWQVMVENEPMKEFSIKDVAHDWAVTEKRNGSTYSYWIRPLYATPPEQWVGLTDDEMMEPWPFETRIEFLRWIENKLREKNG